jgi:hypothetical protein
VEKIPFAKESRSDDMGHYYNLVPRTNTPNEITAGTIFYQTRQEPRAKAFSPFHNAAVG